MYNPDKMWREIKEGSLRNCPVELIEVDIDCDVMLSNFNFDNLKTLILKTVMYFGNVNHYIKKASSTLEELQISAVEYEKIYYSKMLSNHDTQCEDDGTEDAFCQCVSRELGRQAEEFQNRDCLSLPALKTFRAISNDPFTTVHQEEERGPYGTTVKDFKIWAPNVEELIYKNYFGWDMTLFNSCSSNLKKVYFGVNLSNVNCVYQAICKLSACELLTLVSSKCLYEGGSRIPNHPFEGTADDETFSIPCKGLIKLKDLTIVSDKKVTGDGLIRFVKYKKESRDCQDLDQLVLDDCSSVTDSSDDKLKILVPSYLKTCAFEKAYECQGIQPNSVSSDEEDDL